MLWPRAKLPTTPRRSATAALLARPPTARACSEGGKDQAQTCARVETHRKQTTPPQSSLETKLFKPAACTDAIPACLAHKVVQMQVHAACRAGP